MTAHPPRENRLDRVRRMNAIAIAAAAARNGANDRDRPTDDGVSCKAIIVVMYAASGAVRTFGDPEAREDAGPPATQRDTAAATKGSRLSQRQSDASPRSARPRACDREEETKKVKTRARRRRRRQNSRQCQRTRERERALDACLRQNGGERGESATAPQKQRERRRRRAFTIEVG